ncbi:tyrosine-protein phosphatase [Rhizobium ruizarguesonis]
MSQTFDRLLALEGAFNVRDLGGYATRTAETTRWRSVLRGDGLHRLSEGDIDTLLTTGVTTVIDLRNAEETAVEENPFRSHPAVRFHNTSLFHGLAPIDIAASSEDAPFDMAMRYRDALDTCRDAVCAVLRAIADAPDGIVLYHCSAGKDRTGIISAILLSLADVDDDAIIDDYALTATISGPLIGRLREKALERGTAPALIERFLACEPQTMRATLDHIRRTYGGAADYLTGLGLTPADLAALRRRLL